MYWAVVAGLLFSMATHSIASESLVIPDGSTLYVEGVALRGQVEIECSDEVITIGGVSTPVFARSTPISYETFCAALGSYTYFENRSTREANYLDHIETFNRDITIFAAEIVSTARSLREEGVEDYEIGRRINEIYHLRDNDLFSQVKVLQDEIILTTSVTEGEGPAKHYPFDYMGKPALPTPKDRCVWLLNELHAWFTAGGPPVVVFVHDSDVLTGAIGNPAVQEVEGEICDYLESGTVGRILRRFQLEAIQEKADGR